MIQLMLTYLRIPATKLYSLLIPVLLKADTPYESEEGCLSLVGVRKTTRYQNIEVEYIDKNWIEHDKIRQTHVDNYHSLSDKDGYVGIRWQ